MSFKNTLKKGIATILTSIVLSSPVIAKEFDVKEPVKIELKDKITEYKPENLLELAINIPLAYFSTVYTHELGHCGVAQSYGLDNIKINSTIDSDKMASFSYDGNPDLSETEENILDLAGVGNTRLSYELVNSLMEKDRIPNRLEPLMSTYALFSRFDLPYQLMVGARNHFFDGDNEVLDFEHFVGRVSKERNMSKDTIYGILIGAELIDLYLDRKEIDNHFKRALGKEVDFSDENNLDLDLFFDGKNLGFNLSYEF